MRSGHHVTSLFQARKYCLIFDTAVVPCKTIRDLSAGRDKQFPLDSGAPAAEAGHRK
jgi:hypothetical protein